MPTATTQPMAFVEMTAVEVNKLRSENECLKTIVADLEASLREIAALDGTRLDEVGLIVARALGEK